ncbi:hypothetical protein [Mesorhizobium sp. 128a]
MLLEVIDWRTSDHVWRPLLAVALANKTGRMVWALMTSGKHY